MRNITKTITLPVGESTMDFRLTKLDAFSGARLLKLLSHAESDSLQQLIFSLPEQEMDSLMKTCLRSVSALLPAGPIPVLLDGSWGIPDLEYRMLCRVVTSLRTYDNMLLSALSVQQDDTCPDGWTGTLTFTRADSRASAAVSYDNSSTPVSTGSAAARNVGKQSGSVLQTILREAGINR